MGDTSDGQQLRTRNGRQIQMGINTGIGMGDKTDGQQLRTRNGRQVQMGRNTGIGMGDNADGQQLRRRGVGDKLEEQQHWNRNGRQCRWAAVQAYRNGRQAKRSATLEQEWATTQMGIGQQLRSIGMGDKSEGQHLS